MKRDFNPVDVELSIENPSIERGAFYRLCFITESNIAPRTLKVTRLQDLLDNGYSRLDLAYNFCVGVFSQQGIDTVYIRAKRSYESYVEAYNSDDNSMYYFVVLQTKDLTEVEKFNSHLVSSDEMKLQFFSQNVGSKILQSPKLVNYYQDYTLSGGASVESKDYYLNKAYSGVTVVNKLPLPDYLLGGYGDTAVDYGVRMMVGKDYIWEIDKPNRQIRYARNVIDSGWVGSREDSTINNSEVTVVATKGRSGKLLRASIKDPKVKIETLSRELLKGLGKEVLDYAIPLIDPEAKDWELDAVNNSVKYTVASDNPIDGDIIGGGYYWKSAFGGDFTSVNAAAADNCAKFNRGAVTAIDFVSPTKYAVVCANGSGSAVTRGEVNTDYSPDDGYKYLPIDIVAAKVIANAESGHVPSQTFLKSIPLFAYLLTGSGTEAVNKAVLDIDPEATDWVLDPVNNAVKYTLPSQAGDSTYSVQGYSGDSMPVACNAYASALNASFGFTHLTLSGTAVESPTVFNCKFSESGGGTSSVQGYVTVGTGTPAQEKSILIDTVATKVISNAESGHVPSQEALRLSTVERVNTGEYDEALEAASIEIETSWKYLPIYDVAVQVKRNSIAGHAESIEAVNNSLPFEIPNYEPNITITGIAKVGETLTATVTDANGVPSNINYQWYVDGEVISDATAETYVLKESDSGKTITVQANFTDKDGFSESVTGTVDVEYVESEMGLRADYSGSGWYKATDTGTVFNKGVSALETHVFSDSPTEYVSVYTKEDAKLYGERAAVSNITDMSSMFYEDTSFNSDISSWDVSNVADMSLMFEKATTFNQNISNWDVSNVIDMNSLFYNATAFNQDLSSWDVSNVTDMEYMFGKANSFNSDLSSWNVSNVTNMRSMFYEVASFVSDLSSWNTSKVTNMRAMFYEVTSFNSDISSWDVSNVTNMRSMFYEATSFNSVTSSWDVSNVTDMRSMFQGATLFNSDISNWNVSKVTDMGFMFNGATSFNQDISNWNMSLVTDTSTMFQNATSFNSDLSLWNTNIVIDMSYMFNGATSFNQDISNWNVSSVTNMRTMFQNATSFNQDLSEWCVSLIPTKPEYFDTSASAWTLPRPVWGTCPSSSGGDNDTPWAFVPEETSVTGSTTTIKAERTFENQKLKSSITVAASSSKVGQYLNKGDGSDALDYAMDELAVGAIEWVLDPDSNRVRYTVTGVADGSRICKQWTMSGENHATAQSICDANASPNVSYTPSGGLMCSGRDFTSWKCGDDAYPATIEKYVSAEALAAQVISNAESGHAPSQEAVKATALEGFVAGEHDAALDAAAVIDN